MKCRHVRSNLLGQPSGCLTGRIRRLLAKSDQCMPKKRTKRGSGCNQQLFEFSAPAAPSQEGLTQTDHIRAQFPLNLQFVPSHRHFQVGQEIGALQHPMTRFHVQKLNRKYVGGIPQLLEREEKRRRMALAPPPQSHRPQLLQIRTLQAMQQAKNIEVRMLAKFMINGRAVENHRLQVLTRCLLQASDKLIQILLSIHRASLLPTASCSAPARCSSSEATETSASPASAKTATPTSPTPTSHRTNPPPIASPTGISGPDQ